MTQRAALWRQSKPWEREKLRLYAHVLTVPGEPVYSHFSAARLHGLFIWNCSALVHITAPAPASGASSAKDVKSHHDVLDDAELEPLTLQNGSNVLATTLERTVVDCARVGGFAEAVIIGDHALASGARLDVMWDMVNSSTGRRGVRRARRVLRSLDGHSESPGESRTRLIIATMKIDQPQLQRELLAGDKLYRPDFVWEKQRLIVEFDGDIKYFSYRRTAEVILEERKRERRLMEAGWRFVRLEWKDLAHPGEVQRRILTVYNAPFMALAA
ncbi:hypothetical protein [Arthrobacter sp. PAMC 25486]|uniref:hypothetical protein n=1 Tax=Arthrobacter sp. PAMC 25486 TaxID=1494608 RepID=UPI00138DF4E7|nr:hypothetical protein [Arthrobacter sp. PAMC 25486]